MERSTEAPANRLEDRPIDQGLDRSINRLPPEESIGGFTDRGIDRSTEASNEGSTRGSTEGANETSTGPSIDWSIGRPIRPIDQPID
jgi:hypothetical protein